MLECGGKKLSIYDSFIACREIFLRPYPDSITLENLSDQVDQLIWSMDSSVSVIPKWTAFFLAHWRVRMEAFRNFLLAYFLKNAS